MSKTTRICGGPLRHAPSTVHALHAYLKGDGMICAGYYLVEVSEEGELFLKWQEPGTNPPLH